jgi:hypothetical protein
MLMHKIVTILLTHQSAEKVEKMLKYWRAQDVNQYFIVAHGGDLDRPESSADYWVKIADPLLRTKDHPRERQSYLGVFAATVSIVEKLGATHVHLAEFDEIPLVNNLNQKLLNMMEHENCDVLGHCLRRVDDTTSPHYMDHQKDAAFSAYWASISKRKETEVVLSMLGCGSFWRYEVFAAVAKLAPPMRIYLELFLPTAAHHLGYRVRPMPQQQDAFMDPEKKRGIKDLEHAKRQGAWRLHPVKEMWD